MSAITGSGEPLTISFKASAASWSGTAGLTISHPASLSSWICRSVALTSRVSVLVMVCTAMGAAPPMTTPPTLTGIDFRRETIRDAAGVPAERFGDPGVAQPKAGVDLGGAHIWGPRVVGAGAATTGRAP